MEMIIETLIDGNVYSWEMISTGQSWKFKYKDREKKYLRLKRKEMIKLGLIKLYSGYSVIWKKCVANYTMKCTMLKDSWTSKLIKQTKQSIKYWENELNIDSTHDKRTIEVFLKQNRFFLNELRMPEEAKMLRELRLQTIRLFNMKADVVIIRNHNNAVYNLECIIKEGISDNGV